MMKHDLRKHYVETARGFVHVQEAGAASDPALVLVTPTSFAAPLLDGVLPVLAGLGWHALALDLMGYGRSDKREGHWLIDDFADNVLDAIASCGVTPVGLAFGHFSSWVGIEIASRRVGGRPVLPTLRGLALDGTPRVTAAQRAERQAEGPPGPTPWDEQGSHALAYWQKVAAEKYPNGLPKPHSDDPTQWLFNGHPRGSDAPLQVAVARLLGYRWPRQTGSSFPDCPALGPDI